MAAHPARLNAAVSFVREGGVRVNVDRVGLLRAVDETRSISAAARRLGLSYKGAWDQVQALNNLFEGPLIEAERGGRCGGEAGLTPRGRAAEEALRRVRMELDAALAKLDVNLGGGVARDLFWSLGVKTSVRNALRGRVTRIIPGAINGEVVVAVGEESEVVSALTNRSIQDLGLAVGDAVIALIQAGDVILAQGEALRTSARNQLRGHVVDRQDGAVNSEISIDLGGAKTLVATVTLESALALDLALGTAVQALIKAPHVILAMEN